MELSPKDACLLKPLELLEQAVIGCLAISIKDFLGDDIDKVKTITVKISNHKLRIDIKCDKSVNNEVNLGIRGCLICQYLNLAGVIEVSNE